MWSEQQLEIINNSLSTFCKMWRILLSENFYKIPTIKYNIAKGQRIDFVISINKDNSDEPFFKKEFRVCCSCDSPMAVISDCQRAFRKHFG